VKRIRVKKKGILQERAERAVDAYSEGGIERYSAFLIGWNYRYRWQERMFYLLLMAEFKRRVNKGEIECYRGVGNG